MKATEMIEELLKLNPEANVDYIFLDDDDNLTIELSQDPYNPCIILNNQFILDQWY